MPPLRLELLCWELLWRLRLELFWRLRLELFWLPPFNSEKARAPPVLVASAVGFTSVAVPAAGAAAVPAAGTTAVPVVGAAVGVDDIL